MVSHSAPPMQQLGRYRVVRRLGAGGMAEVFLARSAGAEGIDKMLVLKRVLPTFARSAKFRSMFIDEAKVAMRLNHPNIVQVYAFEQVKDEFLLAMEFVDGLDLGRLISTAKRLGKKIPHGLAAFVVGEVAKGLDYAHNRKDEQGLPLEIVHRDVSPQNVLLTYEGGVKVADFGIARARMVSEETGVIKGKFSYMSPEQARGSRVDRKSDVYALGVLLAELLMGRTMYAGQVGLEVLELVRQGTRTLPRSVDAGVPEALDDIVRRATEYDVESRYPNARALASALGQWLHGQDEVFDGAALEQFIHEIAPRETTNPDAGRSRSDRDESAPEKQTLAGDAEVPRAQEFRERRHVVVISGRIHSGTLAGGNTSASLSREGERVLREMAYKNDAVFRAAEGTTDSRRLFRMVLGLGRVTVHEPLRAARLALDVLDALSGVAADQDEPLRVSLGISRGVVTTTRSPDGRLKNFEAVGAVLDMADRLATAGSPAEIFTAGEIYRAARRDFSFDDRDAREITLVGEQGPRAVRSYRLVRARTREEREAVAQISGGRDRLIGRDTELREIKDVFTESVQSKKSATMLVVGELGVGKSALAQMAIEQFDPKPRILRADCAFGSNEIAFASLIELVRDACGIAPDASPDQVVERIDATLADLFSAGTRRDETREGLLTVVLPRRADAGAQLGEESQRVTHSIRNLFGALANKEPLVVLIDSMQWADAPSLSLLATLVRNTYDLPLFGLFLTRPETVVESALASVPRMELGELDTDGRVELVRARFDHASVPNEIEQLIVERAGGNPYFVCELVEALLERGVVRIENDGAVRRVVRQPGPIVLPTTLEGTVAARLAELPDVERHALRWLSAVGPGMTQADLTQIAGVDLKPALDSLLERALIEQKAAGTYAITSGVIRHVAYDSADPDDRRHMHKRIAAHLSSQGQAVPPARIARHLERAGQHIAAARLYVAAAERTQGVDAIHYALRLFAKAIALFPPDDPERFRVHESREALLRAAGRRHERRVELEAMRALSERLNDATMRASAYNHLARYELDEGRTAGVDALLRRAMSAAIEAGDKAAEVESLRLSAHLARDEGDLEKAIDACDRALVRAGRDEATLAVRGDVLALRGQLLRRAGRLDEACENGAEAVVIFRRLKRRRDEGTALLALAISLASSGSLEDAIVLTRTSIDLDRETGSRVGFGHKLSVIGQLYAELGDNASAESYLERALELFEVVVGGTGHADALTALARVITESRDDFDGASFLLERARSIATAQGSRYDLAQERIARSRLELRRRNYEEALDAAHEAVREARASGVVTHVAHGLALEAESLALIGRSDEALDAAFSAQSVIRSATHIERAEAVFSALFHAFSLIDPNAARSVALEAKDALDQRFIQIRDPQLRECYLKNPLVQRLTEATR